MALSFEWDDEKAAANLIKHRVAFEDAVLAFYDPHRLDDRFLTIGLVDTAELAVAYTVRDDTIRLISARKAERHERHDYWENR